jgi:hypothetical protein
MELTDRLHSIDINTLSPVDAWRLLDELKKMAEGDQ